MFSPAPHPAEADHQSAHAGAVKFARAANSIWLQAGEGSDQVRGVTMHQARMKMLRSSRTMRRANILLHSDNGDYWIIRLRG
jgi:hypothetical protein